MSEWISVKEKPLDPERDKGWYVVLISRNPHVVYFGFRNWMSPWHIAEEWKDPTHYIKIPDFNGNLQY